MTRPVLKRSDTNDSVKVLQDLLNRNGALLIEDGNFGPATETAVREAQVLAGLDSSGIVENRTWRWLESQPLPAAQLCTADLNFIVREEVGDRRLYEQVAARPHSPGAESGVTIGIGYDLRFHGERDLASDWQNELPEDVFRRLLPWLGKRGPAASSLQDIRIPFASAWRVFTSRTLPLFVSKTRAAYPAFPLLPDGCRGALVSLVYNRGVGMSGDSRREMRNIALHLKNNELDRVPGEFEAMRRLWPDTPGLCERRRREAERWRQGLRLN